MKNNVIKYSTGSQVANSCYQCEQRTKYGDCHIFCPAYKKYIREKEKIRKAEEKEKQSYYLAYNVWGNQQPKATTIERLRKKRY